MADNKKQFFYIVMQNKQIFELEKTEQKMATAFGALRDKAIATYPKEEIVINGSYIAEILGEEQYYNFVESIRPKTFIKHGAWYEINDRNKPIRYEKWRQDELDAIEQSKQKEIDNRNEVYVDRQHFLKATKEFREKGILPKIIH